MIGYARPPEWWRGSAPLYQRFDPGCLPGGHRGFRHGDNEGGLPVRWSLTLFGLTWMPRKEPQPPPLTWEIYLARSTPAKYVGRIEAADADAAIEAASNEFEVKDPNWLIAVRRG
jgi:hypothetical protein